MSSTQGKAPKKAGAPECGLYVRIPDDFLFEDIVPKLRHLFLVTTRSDYEKNMHVLEIPMPYPDDTNPGGGRIDHVREIANYARQNGFVVILRGPAEMMERMQADGILLAPDADIAAARAIVGDDAIVGLRCIQDRALAERAAQAGADYVSFSAPVEGRLIAPDILSWWSTASDIPALIEGAITNDDCGAYVRAGAVFIESGDYILNHPKGVLQGAVDMLYAIDLALGDRARH